MNVVVTIQHPAHVHFFKHAIAELEADGHAVTVVARDNEIAVDLLELYDIEHTVLASHAGSLSRLAAVQLTYELRLLRLARKIDPDVITGIGGVAAAHVAPLVGARSVVFTDTEHATIINTLAHPVADVVATPSCYDDEMGDNQVSYPSYHELAYLHPDRFEPDPSVFDDLNVSPEETFVVLRVIGWDSSHDIGASGLDDVHEAVDRLEAAGAKVLITSEVPRPDDLERCRTLVEPHRIHHLLYYADCFVGEGATMAAESAELGTPAVYVNSLTMGYTDELEAEYDLLYNFPENGEQDAALEQAIEIVEDDADRRWDRRRSRMLTDKQDTTAVVRRLLEHAAADRDPPATVSLSEQVAPPQP